VLFLFENCALDTDRRELWRAEIEVPVEPQVFDLLEYLIRNRERVVSKDDLIASIWRGRVVSDSTLSTRITAARTAIGDSGEEQRLIKTLPRKGVRFVSAVRERHEASEVAVATPRIASGIEAARQSRTTFHGGSKPAIAVLPFANLGDDLQYEYFADGVAEEIITALSRCKGLLVIARNSSFVYKGKSLDVRQIGRELGVRYVLEGSIRRGGKRLRFTAQLIDATSGAQIWADRFEGEMNEVFELQDLITANVVGAIEPNIESAEIERLKHKSAENIDAYDLMLHAKQLEAEFTESSLVAAVDCLKKAVAIDPSYALAMALTGYCYAERRNQGWSLPPQDAAEGLRMARRAIELGRDDAAVLWMCAYAMWRLDLNAPQARELAHRSLALNPNSAGALSTTAWIETFYGNRSKALELFDLAERLSPRDPRAWFAATGRAFICLTENCFSEALSWAQKALIQNPRFALALRVRAASLALLGQHENASAALREALKVEPHVTISEIRSRTMFLDEDLWNKYSEGLRLAGLPE